MKKHIIFWNTERPYSAFGQRMAATKLHNHRVAFVDVDRGLQYVTTVECHGELTQQFVMLCYDSNFVKHLPNQLTYVDELKHVAKEQSWKPYTRQLKKSNVELRTLKVPAKVRENFREIKELSNSKSYWSIVKRLLEHPLEPLPKEPKRPPVLKEITLDKDDLKTLKRQAKEANYPTMQAYLLALSARELSRLQH